jgi:hypothetical protein
MKFSKMRASVRTDIFDTRQRIEFNKKRGGKIEVLVQGYHAMPTTEMESCSLGHRHVVMKEKKFIRECVTLSAREVEALSEWFLKSPALHENNHEV